MRLEGWMQGTDSRPSFETRVSSTQERRRFALLRMRSSICGGQETAFGMGLEIDSWIRGTTAWFSSHFIIASTSVRKAWREASRV
jgi:hypothetical protein